MRRIGATLIASALCCSCETTPTLPERAAFPVITAYLYAGEPVTDVHIATTVALGSSDTVGVPINDAVLVLTKLGIRYALTPAGGDSGYYHYTGEDLSVNEGDTFDLDVTYSGSVATARTVVPVQPGVVTLSSDSIVVPTFGRGPGGTPGAFGTQLIARWPNPSRDLYYVTVEAAGDSLSPITSGFRGARRFVFPPIEADSFAVSPASLVYYGQHRVKVYHVNTEYAALYESRRQDSRDLNEPATNVRNGLGVFSAFSSRSVTFRAVAEQ